MKVAIIGAGFTGLSAALKLLKAGHQVTIFEKESAVGGLAGGFKNPEWKWFLDKSYHHIFSDDKFAFKLAEEVDQKMLKVRPRTDTFIKGRILPLDSPFSLLSFPYLSIIDKLRMGGVVVYFKLLNNYKKLEGKKALPWIKKFMGKKSTDLVWEPLFTGKFGKYKNDIALTWFWSRIKKRSSNLYYPEGGFQNFTNRLAEKIKSLKGKIILNFEVKNIENISKKFDKTIVTLPIPVFLKTTPTLPKTYIKNLNSIPHLVAQILILELKEPFLKGTYWLNINDQGFPFLVMAEHTNFVSNKYYGEKHILYIGNYLEENHPYLKKSSKELFKIFKPFLTKINPDYQFKTTDSKLFIQKHAQPIAATGYEKVKPDFKTPLKNVYLANMSMIYPWDRETNYAIELGEKIADLVIN